MTIIYIFIALIGLCVGSFLNVVIYRVPNNMSVAFPPSHCPKCNNRIRWYDNIPIFSYLILKGKCRHCKEKISPTYLLVELSNAVLYLLIFAVFGVKNAFLGAIYCAFVSLLICIFCIDIKYKLIYDRFNIAIIVLAFLSFFCDNAISINEKLIGFICIGGFFTLIYYGAILILKREGLGGGDVKLAFCISLLLGWKLGLLAMFLSVLIGSVVLFLVQMVCRMKKGIEFPFAPFIAIGTLISLFYGNAIIGWYLSLFI